MTPFRYHNYQWAQWGDLNAFFGLILDNISNLVILTGILAGIFAYPLDSIFTLMIPGTALGVLFGDAAYTWLAFRLAKRTGRTDVTAMPLGLDTPSSIGITSAVIGPVYLETRDAVAAWQVGMATLMIIGIFKLILSFWGEWVRRHVPQAGLLGSLAGIGVTLLAFFPLMKIFSAPVAGIASLGIILYAILARRRLPFGIPGALAAVIVGCALYYLAGAFGLFGLTGIATTLPGFELHPAAPIPTLGFIHGMGKAISYLPIAFPFALITILGGINNTESARVAGDEYKTRDILLTEALATMLAALFGGVAQTTPYIGHPAYKAMGGRAAYTLAAGLFIGIGGVLGVFQFVIEAIPEAVITPILLFVGIEIVAQAFLESPRRHAQAVVFAMIPSIGYLALTSADSLIEKFGTAAVPATVSGELDVLRVVGHGFILTAILWGGLLADLIDGKTRRAAGYAALCTVCTLFGLIHSATPAGGLYLPWRFSTSLTQQVALGYFVVAVLLFLAPKASGRR
jgi:AGZA family xanthine/uracil permease-like MFS transporter